MAGYDAKAPAGVPSGAIVTGGSAMRGWIKVRALGTGTSEEYGQRTHFFRQPGDEFMVREELFSPMWMEKVVDGKPLPPIPDPEKLPQTTISPKPMSYPGQPTTY